MEFNLNKCEMMHFEILNKSRIYTVNGRILSDLRTQIYHFSSH